LERPSQDTLETRKAIDGDKSAHDALHAARAALRGMHAAERQLFQAHEQSSLRQALDAIDAMHRLSRAAGQQAISAKYAARLLAQGANLDSVSRHAMRQRMQLEEAAEFARYNADQDREAARNRQDLLRRLADARKAKQRALQQRHRLQRTALALLL